VLFNENLSSKFGGVKAYFFMKTGQKWGNYGIWKGEELSSKGNFSSGKKAGA